MNPTVKNNRKLIIILGAVLGFFSGGYWIITDHGAKSGLFSTLNDFASIFPLMILTLGNRLPVPDFVCVLFLTSYFAVVTCFFYKLYDSLAENKVLFTAIFLLFLILLHGVSAKLINLTLELGTSNIQSLIHSTSR